MPMKNPCHPGELVLRNCIEPLDLTITKAAQHLRVSRVQLSRLVNGKSAVSPDMAIRLSKAFGSTAEHWLRLQMAWDLAQVKKRAGSIKVKRVPRSALLDAAE